MGTPISLGRYEAIRAVALQTDQDTEIGRLGLDDPARWEIIGFSSTGGGGSAQPPMPSRTFPVVLLGKRAHHPVLPPDRE